MLRSMRAVLGLVLIAAPVAAQPTKEAAPELVTAARAQTGTYRCRGEVTANVDEKRKVTGTLTITTELDGRWLVWRLVPGRGPKSKPIRYTIYRSFDASARTWNALQLDSTGGRAELTAPASDDGKLNWDGTLYYRGMKVAIRDHQEPVRGGLRLWGEYETEPGLYLASYDVTCKK